MPKRRSDSSFFSSNSKKWNDFIKNNSKVQEKFGETVQQAISAGESTFDVETHVALSMDDCAEIYRIAL